MQPDSRFLQQPMIFWANVRTISQKVGYTRRGSILVPTPAEVATAYGSLDLTTHHLFDANGDVTEMGDYLFSYFQYRADVLNGHVAAHLMDAPEARERFEELFGRVQSARALVMNKQKGD